MKAWLLISAVLAGLLVGYWIGRMTPQQSAPSRSDASVSVQPQRINETPAPKNPPQVGVVTTTDRAPDGSPAIALLSRPGITPDEDQRALLDRLNTGARQLPSPEIRHQQKTGDTWHENAQLRLLAEPEDSAWAPYMENAITLFLSRHPAAKGFEVEYVECRSSQCQIKVSGHEESTGPSWQRIVQDMLREPWASFGQYANASGPSEGRFVIVQDLQRRE